MGQHHVGRSRPRTHQVLAASLLAATTIGLVGCGSSTPTSSVSASTTASGPTTAPTAAVATTAAPAPSTTAPSTTTGTTQPKAASVATGAHFDEVCTVVAPPQSDQQSTEFNASCPDVPEQYQFVQVQIDDPHLQVDPDDAGVRVQGRVVGTATSEVGYKVVEVLATKVTHVANG